MRVESKFMTGEVRIEGMRLGREGLVVEGKVQSMLPVRVVMTAADLRAFGRLLPRGVLEALAPGIAARIARGR